MESSNPLAGATTPDTDRASYYPGLSNGQGPHAAVTGDHRFSASTGPHSDALSDNITPFANGGQREMPFGRPLRQESFRPHGEDDPWYQSFVLSLGK
jgi:hypothetical protein